MPSTELRDLFYQELIAAEADPDLVSLRHHGIDFWPIMRKEIYFRYYNDSDIGHGALKKSNKKNRWVIALVFNTFLSLFKARSKVIFFGIGHSYTTVYQGRSLHKLFSPLLEEIGHEGVVLHDGQTWEKLEDRGLDIKPLLVLTVMLAKPWSFLPSTKQRNYLLKLKQKFCKINDQHLNDVFAICIVKYHFYRLMLQVAKPKILLCANYYDSVTQPLICAANSLRIPTVDIQHGIQTGQHIAYTHWRHIPDSGYNALPSAFWHWDPLSAQSNERTLRHHAKRYVTGQIWMNYLMQHDQSLARLKAAAGGKKVALFCAQPLETPFPDSLAATIRETHQDYCWIIRMHPRMMSDTAKFEDQLTNLGIAHLIASGELTEAELLPQLQLADVHVCLYSSTVIEASLLQTPTAILHPVGKTMYDDYQAVCPIFYHFHNTSFREQLEQLALSAKAKNTATFAKQDYASLIEQTIADHHA